MNLKHLCLVGAGLALGVTAVTQLPALAAAAGSPLPLDELRQLTDVFGLIKSDYVEPVTDQALLDQAITGMVGALDPQSSYLDKKAYRELRDAMQGKYSGIGIDISLDEGYVRVVAPFEDAPAARAGIVAGDVITRIDGVLIKGLTLDEVLKKLRGQPNSKVRLTVARKGQLKPLVYSVVRAELQVQSVKARLVAPGYGWLRIAQFQSGTVDEMAAKITALYAQDPHLKGLVLDLRNDPGGVLPGAIGVAAAFLPKDAAIVSTKGQLAGANQTFYGRAEFYAGPSKADALAALPDGLKALPLVVLVNGGSASASEIVAGALQDYRRAIILGSQTFGKGSVQTVRTLTPDTALKLTTARYYTPHGHAIQAGGIVPDRLVNETAGPESTPVQRPVYGSADDFQLTQALNELQGLPVIVAPGVLSKMSAEAAQK